MLWLFFTINFEVGLGLNNKDSLTLLIYWTKQINFSRIFFSKHNSKTWSVSPIVALFEITSSPVVFIIFQNFFISWCIKSNGTTGRDLWTFFLSFWTYFCMVLFLCQSFHGFSEDFLGISFDGDPDPSLFLHYFSFLRISFPGGLFHVDALHTFFFEDDK